MTGFGEADSPVSGGKLRAEVRTVNHRFFSPSIKLPSAWSRYEADVRERMRNAVSRGHVTLSVRLEREVVASSSVLRGMAERARAAQVVAELRSVVEEYGLTGGVDLPTVLRYLEAPPAASETDDAADPAPLLHVVDRALLALTQMRAQEGERLGIVLHERCALVESALGRIALRAPERLTAHRVRLRGAVADLTDGVTLDPQRIAQEIAILADRLDVAEELDRFRAHIDAFRATLTDGGREPAGKRLGFLLQEMLREANTTGSKANDAAIAHDVVGVKEELERMREQVENLE